MSELEKQSRTIDQRIIIDNFLDWLNEKKVLLGSYIHPFKDSDTERMAPILKNRQELLDEYFDIDPIQLDKERRGLLKQTNNYPTNVEEKKEGGK